MKMDLGADKLPVRFSYDATSKRITIYNAEEKIICDPAVITSDSLIFKAPVFENEFRLKIISPSVLKGYWYSYSRGNYRIACEAMFHSTENTSIIKGESKQQKFEVHFSPKTSDEYNAIGLFQFYPAIELHKAEYVPLTGTFMTEAGDYRYLEGQLVNGTNLTLSCFDGSHAFLFKAKYNATKDSLKGTFYSGNHHSEPWLAWINNNVTLRNPDSLTLLEPGVETISFGFPDLNGDTVRFPSEKYKNKVTIIQIMGSWCPNCMDETVFLNDVHKQYASKGLEILALCFERSDDFNKASMAVTKMKESLHSPYDFLIAGSANKNKAHEKLRILSCICSYPTTIYIDKKGKVRKIFTGYYGPSTGSYHTMYKEQTLEFIQKLLKE